MTEAVPAGWVYCTIEKKLIWKPYLFLMQLSTVVFWWIPTMVVWTSAVGQHLDQLQPTNALLHLQLMEQKHECARPMELGLGRNHCVQVSTEVQASHM